MLFPSVVSAAPVPALLPKIPVPLLLPVALVLPLFFVAAVLFDAPPKENPAPPPGVVVATGAAPVVVDFAGVAPNAKPPPPVAGLVFAVFPVVFCCPFFSSVSSVFCGVSFFCSEDAGPPASVSCFSSSARYAFN